MSQSENSPGQVLRDTVAASAIQVPGAPNALVGRMIQQTGFRATYLSGAAISAGVRAVPDVGLVTLGELTRQVQYLTDSVSIPVIVDADTGFGGPADVARTVDELERAGAAAIQIEDQQLPKRCGHLEGKELVDAEAMCEKVHAAVAARAEPGTVIIARTDARSVEGLEAAIDRARRYVAAGADWVFPEALRSADEFRAVAGVLDVPLVANMTEFGQSPLMSFGELAGLGYRVVLYPVTMLRVAMKAIEAALVVLAADGSQEELLDLMQTRQELYELLEYDVPLPGADDRG